MRIVNLEPINISLLTTQYLEIKNVFKKDGVPISFETYVEYVTVTGGNDWNIVDPGNMNFTYDAVSVGLSPEVGEANRDTLYLSPIDNTAIPVFSMESIRIAYETGELVQYVTRVNVTFTAP